MISLYKVENVKVGEEETIFSVELRGLSTDVKPIGTFDNKPISNGSTFIEIDTGGVYMYDLDNELWKKINNGGGSEINNQDITVTENGEYTADEGYTGLGTVTVEVPSPSGNINITGTSQVDVSSYATAQVVDADLIAGNIKKDINILGVTGTYEGGGSGSGIDLTSGVKFANSTFQSIPSDIQDSNWNEVEYANEMFYACGNLKNVSFALNSLIDGESMFGYCNNLLSANITNTTNMTSMVSMFDNCKKLTTVNQIDTSYCYDMYHAFQQCDALSNDSLNNILLMCASVPNDYDGTKTLSAVGLSATQRTTCQSLSNYQALLNAGWTAN